jgi:peptidoglycan hydrolase-like protein with peptidoglycan-binding domain
MGPASPPGGVFADTPFATAPPAVQRNVVVSAQIALARYGLYSEQIDGIYGPAMELSLRAYQARTKLPVTGRLDLETLAALRLLPGPRQPFSNPHRQRMRPMPGPPIRGQWQPD